VRAFGFGSGTGITLGGEIGVPVVTLPLWYDVDDQATLRLLQAELVGERPAFAEADLKAEPAFATRWFLEQRHAPLHEPLS